MTQNNAIRPVVWVGGSKKQLKKMPEEVQKQMSGELYFAQKGENPPHGKSFKGIASGVFEIKDDFDTNTYRLVYAIQIGTRCCMRFRSIMTSKKDIDLIARRYKEAEAMEKEYQS